MNTFSPFIRVNAEEEEEEEEESASARDTCLAQG
jgi:hypothetical protein